MAVEEKQRINISLSEKDDCSNILKLRSLYELEQSRPLTLAEVVRQAIIAEIKNNK